MKMRSFLLEAGSIIAWKKYPYIKKLWSKIRGKQLPFNMFTIVTNRTELLTSDYMKGQKRKCSGSLCKNPSWTTWP